MFKRWRAHLSQFVLITFIICNFIANASYNFNSLFSSCFHCKLQSLFETKFYFKKEKKDGVLCAYLESFKWEEGMIVHESQIVLWTTKSCILSFHQHHTRSHWLWARRVLAHYQLHTCTKSTKQWRIQAGAQQECPPPPKFWLTMGFFFHFVSECFKIRLI